MADGNITFSTVLDNKELERELSRLSKKIESIERDISGKQTEKSKWLQSAQELGAKLDSAKAKLYEMQTASKGAFSADQINIQKETVDSLQYQWNAAESQVEKYDRQIQSATKKLNETKEKAAQVADETERSGKNQKNFGSSIDGVNNRLSKMKKRIASLAASALLFSVITKGLTSLREWASDVIETNNEAASAIANLKGALLTMVQPLVDVIIPAFTTLVNILTLVVGKIASFVSWIGGKTVKESAEAAKALNQQKNAINGVGSAAKKAGKDIASFDEINRLSADASGGGGGSSSIVPDFSWSDNIIGMLPNVSEIVPHEWQDAFSKIAQAAEGAGSRISNSWEMLKEESLKPLGDYIKNDFAPSMSDTFSETFAPIFGDAIPVAIDLATTDLENIFELASRIFGKVQGVLDSIKNKSKDVCQSISENWDKYGGDILQGVTDFRNGLWDTFWFIYDNIIDPVSTKCGEILDKLWDKHLAPLWDDIVEFVMSVQSNLLQLWNKFLKPLIDWIIADMAPLVVSIINFINEVIGTVVGVVADVVGAVFKFLDGLIQFITGVFTLDLEKALGGLDKMFSGVVNAIIGVLEGGINLIISGINWLITQFNRIQFDVPDWIPLVGGKHFGINIPEISEVQIPRLAQGAVIPPNREFMAVLGDQKRGTNVEAPLETIQEAVALVMDDYIASNTAGQEAMVMVLRDILQAVLGIQIGDSVIGEAVARYQQKMAVVKGY